MSLRFVQSELLLEKLMIDAKKSLNFGYKLVPNVNINRLSFFFLLLFFGTETSVRGCEKSGESSSHY